MDNTTIILLCLFFAVVFLWADSFFRNRYLNKIISLIDKRLKALEGESDEEL